jgi:23S rRNA (adenine1618-N6)-methyltransferase
MRPTDSKPGLHPRNRHRERYDFRVLVAASPELGPFVRVNPFGDPSIDFADPRAVKALNRALLACFYDIRQWDIPEGYLCPPIPGRADYLHHVADLLASANEGVIPKGSAIRVLDIGVGANAIYPILGHHEYGWHFVGSDIDPGALASARRIVAENPALKSAVEIRRQSDPARILTGLLKTGEVFELSLCNPPFHASLREAREGSERKWRNLGRAKNGAPSRNFGGQGGELWCPGGEEAFLRRMVEESAGMPSACLWFTSLVSKAETLPSLKRILKGVGCTEIQIMAMAQGQKRSRIVAWTFLPSEARNAWRAQRWVQAGS